MTQQDMMIPQYIKKVKSTRCEILKLEPKIDIGETKIKRIIIYGLKSEYQSSVITIQGQPTQPSLVKFENLLAD